jgi:hypothetical protein
MTVNTYILGWGEDDHDPSGQHTLRVSRLEEVDVALEHIAADWSNVAAGGQSAVGPAVRELTGRDPRTFDEFLAAR